MQIANLDGDQINCKLAVFNLQFAIPLQPIRACPDNDSLQQTAVSTNRCHVAGLIQVPEPFPLFDE